jgi:hypothetical protein
VKKRASMSIQSD